MLLSKIHVNLEHKQIFAERIPYNRDSCCNNIKCEGKRSWIIYNSKICDIDDKESKVLSDEDALIKVKDNLIQTNLRLIEKCTKEIEWLQKLQLPVFSGGYKEDEEDETTI